MLNKSILVAVLILLFPCFLLAQSGKLRGIITDQETGNPLPGSNIVVEGTSMGAASGLEGEYIILNVSPGTYTIKVSYLGYQSTIVSNIRINANLTTTLDFQLPSIFLEIDAVEIIAERPIVQRNTTNTIHFQTQEDIKNLPIRGIQNIVSLNAGTIQQNGELYIRGGRAGEIAYFIDGATATNPMYNSQNIAIIQEAIEEIQMQAGGFTAEYGGANSGIINTTIRTGGSKLRGTIDYRTDDFAKGGNEFLATTSRGYHNLVATLGGPFPFSSRLRFFLAGQYNYTRNRSALFIEPFEFNPLNPEQSWFVEDGFLGRTNHIGQPFVNAAGDTIPLKFERNFLPNNDNKNFTGNATFVYNASNTLKFRLTGSYTDNRYPIGWQSFSSALENYYTNSIRREDRKSGLISLRTTHVIFPNSFYDISLNISTRTSKRYDPRFGDDWWKYSDAREWGKAGLDTSEWQEVFFGPARYSTIYAFPFTPPNRPINYYSKNSQNSIGGTFDFVSQIKKNIELKFGGRFDNWSIRQWGINNISGYLSYLYGSNAGLSDQGGRQWQDKLNPDGSVKYTAEYLKRIELTRKGAISYYGWDYDGKAKINDGAYGPRKPLFASGYIQTKFEYRDFILNFGLRYEKVDFNTFEPINYEDPARDATNDWIDVDSLTHTQSFDYFLPRLNFAFPVTDNTVFYAQYGKYIQTGSLDRVFQSVASINRLIPELRTGLAWSGNVYMLQKPERSSQYELGLRQSLTDNFAFTITAFYKDMLDLRSYGRIFADGSGQMSRGTWFLSGIINKDIATSKGLEFTFDLRRSRRLAAKLNYSISSASGTNSTLFTSVPAILDATFKLPSIIYPMDYNQTHRGSLLMDFRFRKGDGGKILEGLGLNLLLTFNSGHNYTKISESNSLNYGTPWDGAMISNWSGFRKPSEPLNSSVTPWNFNVDLSVEKLFYFDLLNIKLYSTILNALNTKNIINVYPTTGADNDDGWLKTPLAKQYIALPGYWDFFQAINLNNHYAYTYNTGNDLWGPPRQIRFGIMLEFK